MTDLSLSNVHLWLELYVSVNRLIHLARSCILHCQLSLTSVNKVGLV